MNLHILTPFYRKNNFDVQFRRLKQFKSWTCIVTYTEYNSYKNFFEEKNYQCYVCEDFKGDAAYCKVNRYINNNIHKINDNDYYMPLMDDDSVPYNFMDKLEAKKINSDVIIVSCTKGHKTPLCKDSERVMIHSTGDLIASKNNMKSGKIAYCQQIFKGLTFKNIRYKEDHFQMRKPSGDGLMAEFLVRNYTDITYVPDLFVKFNYLEKGRYMVTLL